MLGNTITRAMTVCGNARVILINSREMVDDAIRVHHLSPTAAAALGRTLTAASMIGVMLKNKDDSVTVSFNGDGVCGKILAVADYYGNTKGYVEHPQADLPLNSKGKLDVAGAVGKGMLYVVRDEGEREPYVGMTPIVSGEIAEDITSYYAYSEQVPTVCALGVLVDKDLSISCAGGYLLQLLPGATDAEITQLEQNIAAMPSVTEMLHAGKTPEDMMNLAMAGFNPSVLDEREVRYQCDCSRERTEQMLLSLGRKELEKLRDSHEN